jgi:chemosensory pili system protein ChpA (sensor histidine kinase/response regulator)
MIEPTVHAAETDGPAPATGADVSPLAWVEAELRRTLEHAHKALRRFVKEQAAAGGGDIDAVDPAVLRSARTQLHQAVGALELVGQAAAAEVLRASEAAVQRMIARPKTATAAAAETVERASFAVLDFVARILAGKPLGATALYPQYAAVQALAGAERVHPADLWSHDWQWRALPTDAAVAPRAPDADARTEMEALVLALMRQPTPDTQRRMGDLCAALGAGAEGHAATLWTLAAALFEGQAAGLIAADVHTKRVASRLHAMLRAAARGAADAPDRLGRELLFFCLRAPLEGLDGAAADAAPRLAAVQRVWPPDADSRGDYTQTRLGLFDPAHLTQARKRVAAAREAWAAVAAGDAPRSGSVGETMALLADSLERLFPDGPALGRALQSAAAQVSPEAPPSPALAMEVATGVLYVEAVLEDGELDAPALAGRVAHLAGRVEAVAAGAEPQPLEPWMEELYRRVSDRQTMGSVVQELRASLAEVEKHIDAFFRDPAQTTPLIAVPAQLAAMRGVLSVLGIDQASQAVLRMRDEVDALVRAGADAAAPPPEAACHRLADNLGALGFLIDMLGVQPNAAKSLFRFDAASGRLRSPMGRRDGDAATPEGVAASPAAAMAATSAEPAAPDVSAALASASERPALPALPAAPTPAAAGGLDDDAEMREVFLEEAREVLDAAAGALERLGASPDDVAELTALRRAFHTLKGSSRMVGLAAFGESAWACERLYNTRLAEQATMDGPLESFTRRALGVLDDWVETIGQGRAAPEAAARVVPAADALREGTAGDPWDLASAPPTDASRPAAPDLGPATEVAAEPPSMVPPPEPPSLQSRIPDLPSAADLDLASLPVAEDAVLSDRPPSLVADIDAALVGGTAIDAGADAVVALGVDGRADAFGDAAAGAGHPPMPDVAEVVGDLGFELDLRALDEGETAPAGPAAPPQPPGDASAGGADADLELLFEPASGGGSTGADVPQPDVDLDLVFPGMPDLEATGAAPDGGADAGEPIAAPLVSTEPLDEADLNSFFDLGDFAPTPVPAPEAGAAAALSAEPPLDLIEPLPVVGGNAIEVEPAAAAAAAPQAEAAEPEPVSAAEPEPEPSRSRSRGRSLRPRRRQRPRQRRKPSTRRGPCPPRWPKPKLKPRPTAPIRSRSSARCGFRSRCSTSSSTRPTSSRAGSASSWPSGRTSRSARSARRRSRWRTRWPATRPPSASPSCRRWRASSNTR